MAQTQLPELTVLADEARRSPVRLSLDLSPQQCAKLAQDNDLAAVRAFVLKATALGIKGRKLRVEGTLDADVTYICGVSLQPFEASLHVPFAQVYGQPTRAGDTIVLDPLDDNDLEPLVHGAADIADLGYQLFTLALDPYPRHPNLAPASQETVGEADEDEPQRPSPFAVLKDLKR